MRVASAKTAPRRLSGRKTTERCANATASSLSTSGPGEHRRVRLFENRSLGDPGVDDSLTVSIENELAIISQSALVPIVSEVRFLQHILAGERVQQTVFAFHQEAAGLVEVESYLRVSPGPDEHSQGGLPVDVDVIDR